MTRIDFITLACRSVKNDCLTAAVTPANATVPDAQIVNFRNLLMFSLLHDCI